MCDNPRMQAGWGMGGGGEGHNGPPPIGPWADT